MTKICVFGAGAIGGYVGARLALAGEADVSLVARGAHLAAMREKGLTLKQAGEMQVVHPRVTDNPSELGPQDYVILTLKAHGLAAVIDQLLPLLGPDRSDAVLSVLVVAWGHRRGFEVEDPLPMSPTLLLLRSHRVVPDCSLLKRIRPFARQ